MRWIPRTMFDMDTRDYGIDPNIMSYEEYHELFKMASSDAIPKKKSFFSVASNDKSEERYAYLKSLYDKREKIVYEARCKMEGIDPNIMTYEEYNEYKESFDQDVPFNTPERKERHDYLVSLIDKRAKSKEESAIKQRAERQKRWEKEKQEREVKIAMIQNSNLSDVDKMLKIEELKTLWAQQAALK